MNTASNTASSTASGKRLRRLYAYVIILLAVLCTVIALRPALPEPAAYHLRKISDQGNEMHIWAGPWQCVHDQESGLLWEVKSENEDVHHKDWSYSWFDGELGAPASGDCFYIADGCSTQHIVDRANNERWCGVDQWRLPTSAELSGLIARTGIAGYALIDSSLFPHTLVGDYWTSDSRQTLEGVYSYLEEGARAVNFGNGELRSLPYRNAAFVRLVSDEYLDNASVLKEVNFH